MIKYLHLLVLLIGFLNISCSGYSSLSSEEGEYKSQFQNDVPISSGNLSGLHRDAGPNTPVVLIVPGSGPTDLNGNNPSGVLSNVYKQMANALAIEGISTVRVDKRGMFSSEAAGDPNVLNKLLWRLRGSRKEKRLNYQHYMVLYTLCLTQQYKIF